MENKKFYSITKGQLTTMWILGILVFFLAISGGLTNSDSNSVNFFDVVFLLAIIILFFVIFYTVGWKANRKNINK